MLEIDTKTELELSDNIILKSFPEVDQYYAFDIENGDHFNLNATAHWILEKIKANGHFGSLIENFADTFELEKKKALRDVSEMLEFALKNKIIIRRRNNEEKKNV